MVVKQVLRQETPNLVELLILDFLSSSMKNHKQNANNHYKENVTKVDYKVERAVSQLLRDRTDWLRVVKIKPASNFSCQIYDVEGNQF